MRINIYAEEITPRVEIVRKEAEGRQFVGLRIYLLSHPNMHPPTHPDDDTSAVTFWSADGLAGICRLANWIGDALSRTTLPTATLSARAAIVGLALTGFWGVS